MPCLPARLNWNIGLRLPWTGSYTGIRSLVLRLLDLNWNDTTGRFPESPACRRQIMRFVSLCKYMYMLCFSGEPGPVQKARRNMIKNQEVERTRPFLAEEGGSSSSLQKDCKEDEYRCIIAWCTDRVTKSWENLSTDSYILYEEM